MTSFHCVERAYSDDESKLSVGLANISAAVPDIERNKERVLEAATWFKEHGANLAVFPEFALSGYFWEERDDCFDYMREAQTERHADWIEKELQPLIDDSFVGIVLNNLTEGPEGKFYNRTSLVGRDGGYLDAESSYDKVFLPGIEKEYTASGRDDRLVVETKFGKLGFTTCYDYLFNDLLREYSVVDKVHAVIQVASWRAAAARDYGGMNVRTDHYYGDLWDFVMPANSATNQVWTIGCNAVGTHGVSGAAFWGGSGIWAPSGLRLIQASRTNEELLLVHNVDIKGASRDEHDEFDYAFDFNEVYRPMEGSRTFTRVVE